MKTTKMIILIGATAFALGIPARPQAQQAWPYYYGTAYTGAPPAGYYMPSPSGKLYLSMDAGVALQQDVTLSDTIGDSENVTFDPGARLDFDFGYNFTTNWAAELEIGLIINQVKNSAFLGTDLMGVDLVELPVMMNLIYTQPLGRHFSAYVGGGLGGAFSDYSNEFGGTTESDTTFAFQGLAGLKYAINERWDLGVTYKFIGTTEHDVGSGWDSQGNPTEFKSDGTMTHSILVALTFKF